MGKNDYIGGGIFICLGIFIWAYTWHFPVLTEAGGRPPGPALFPQVLGTLFIFFSLLVIVEGRRKSKAPPLAEDEGGNVEIVGEKDYFNPVLVIILIAAFIVVAPHLGFIITGWSVLFILMWKLHVKPIKASIISAIVICFIYFVSAKVLRVPLPRGFLWW